MTDLTVLIPDISCEHCKTALEGAVGGLDGVSHVEVSVDAKTLSVVFDPERVSRAAIDQAIDDQGYRVTG